MFTLFPSKEDKLLGEKYTPIEILDIKSSILKGDSVNKSEKSIKKNLSNTENNFKQKSEVKLEKKIDDKKIGDYKKETVNKKVEESSLKKTTSQQSKYENEYKIRGIVKEVFIRESTGFEILDKAGVNAAFKSKFYPLTKKTNLNIEYTLKLNRR